MPKERYTLVRGYYKATEFGNRLTTEEIGCKTLKEATDLASILTMEEKVMSYIFDNAANKKLTIDGHY